MTKFIEELRLDDWEVETPSGWQSFSGIAKTIEYEEWKVITETNKELICADEHKFLDENWDQIFCKDLSKGTLIQTKDGLEKVLSVEKLSSSSNMFDLMDVEGGNIYYTNDIVSHNTTTVVSFLLHYAMFNENVNVAVLANKAATARDILNKLQIGYENLPKWLQLGICSWNKGSMELENGSKIIAASTSASSVRGSTYNILFLDEFAFVPQQVADSFMASVYPTITSGKDTKVIIVSCVTKDTYLLTDKGYRKIETLIDPSKSGAYIVPDYTIMGKGQFYSSNIVVNQGRVPTNIIKTRYGELECSETHKLWADKDGVQDYYKSNDLRVGDKVSVRYNTNVFGNNDELNFTSSSGIHYDKVTPEIAHSIGKNYILNNEPDDELKEILVHLGFDLSLSPDKVYLPDSVLSWSKKSIYNLLLGILNLETYWWILEDDGFYHFTSFSKELLKQIVLLTTNIGVRNDTFNNKVTIYLGGQPGHQPLDKNGLVWYEIQEVKKSENEVFDVSLPDIENDKWCHSVLYNNFLGHQTPNGMNQFYKLWDDAIKQKNKYIPTRVYWQDVPGRDEKFKEETIANMGQTRWDAEFECNFLGSSNTLISGSKLANLIIDPPIRSQDLLDIYEDPQPNKTYVITVDVAEGVELDYSAFVVFDATQIPYKVVAKYRNNDIPPLRFPDVIEPVGKAYNNAYILCEINNDSHVANILHLEYNYPNVIQTKTLGRGGQVAGQNFSGKGVKYGIKMSKPVKRTGCMNLKTFVEENKLIFTDIDIISELTTFVERYNSFSAEEGKNDDLTMCLVLFSWLVTQEYFKEMTETDIRKQIREEHESKLGENDSTPFGFISSVDANPGMETDADGNLWFKSEDDFSFFWEYNY